MSAQGGTLWIVATPIGTLSDLSPRAAAILGEVDFILAEDTRRARALLSHLGLPSSGRLSSFHEHNESKKLMNVVRRLQSGEQAALISDAGTPALSDPGFQLVRAARSQGIPVSSVPGPSAFTAALAVSGQPPLPALLVGFLPPRSGARRTKLTEFADLRCTLVIFLSPHRIGREIGDIEAILGSDRPATLLKELSKVNEQACVGTLGSIGDNEETTRPRGEYVVVIGPPTPDKSPPEIPDATVLRALYDAEIKAGASRKEALLTVTKETGLRRRQVYQKLFVDNPSSRPAN